MGWLLACVFNLGRSADRECLPGLICVIVQRCEKQTICRKQLVVEQMKKSDCRLFDDEATWSFLFALIYRVLVSKPVFGWSCRFPSRGKFRTGWAISGGLPQGVTTINGVDLKVNRRLEAGKGLVENIIQTFCRRGIFAFVDSINHNFLRLYKKFSLFLSRCQH